MADDVEDFLAHYGVKGMRWGVRNDKEGGGSKLSGPQVMELLAAKKAAILGASTYLADRQGRRDGKAEKLRSKAAAQQAIVDDITANGLNSETLRGMYGAKVSDTSIGGKAKFYFASGGKTQQGVMNETLADAKDLQSRHAKDAEAVANGKWTRNQKIAAGTAFTALALTTVVVAANWKDVKTLGAKGGDDIGFNTFFGRVLGSSTRNWQADKEISLDAFHALDDNDLILPPGMNLHRVSTKQETGLSDRSYAAFEPEDVKRYRAFFTKELQGREPNADFFDVKIEAKENLVSPSKKKRVEAYIELLDEKSTTGYGTTWRQELLMGDKQATADLGRKTYNNMVMDQTNNTALSAAYFQKLRDKGYNMVVDDMDSGVIGETPVILLNNKATKISAVTPLSKEDIKEARDNLVEINNRR